MLMVLPSSSCSDMMSKMLTHDHLEVSVALEHHDGLRLPAPGTRVRLRLARAYACACQCVRKHRQAYASVPMRTLEVASPHHDEKMMKKHDDDLDNLILKRLVIIKMR